MGVIKLKKQIQADLLILLMTFFWGSSYVFTKLGMEEVRPFMLSTLRFGIGFLFAAAFLYKKLKRTDRRTLKISAVTGSLLSVVFALQTFSLFYTSVSNASFLINLTVILVPLISLVLLHERPDKNTTVAVMLAFIGVILLTGVTNLNFNFGDILAMLCALGFAAHILLIGKYSKEVDALQLGVWQLGFAAIISMTLSLVIEPFSLSYTTTTWAVVLFLAVFCTAAGYVAQSYAQQFTSATHVALIFTLEPVFGAGLAFLILGETLTKKGWCGAGLLLFATLLSELKLIDRLSMLRFTFTKKQTVYEKKKTKT